jgi:predicted acylesterase/phospholipase RssA
MRGCVSAGMAAAIASLGLCDTFDAVYGSSAGSVIGSYMVSRQMCMDVYVDVLPAAKKKFVCKQRLIRSLATSLVDLLVDSLDRSKAEKPKLSTRQNPGMNISFVLDGILGEESGIRPLDFDTFERNTAKQELRVAASCVRNGTMFSKCFGSEDFFGEQAAKRFDKSRTGLFACLEASMTVPGYVAYVQ